MRTPNGWHHHERVYIQARSGDSVLVQYTDRQLIPGRALDIARHGQRTHYYRPPILSWAWVPDADVMPFNEFDDAMLAVWKIA